MGIVRGGHAAGVPIYRERHDTIVAASPQACFDALIDVERLPSWQQTLRAARVIDRDERGRPSLVELEAHDADHTLVALDLGIDPGRFVPGPLRALIADAVMRRALADLKAHVEGDG